MGEKRKLTSQKNERRIERDLDEEGNVSAKLLLEGIFLHKKPSIKAWPIEKMFIVHCKIVHDRQ